MSFGVDWRGLKMWYLRLRLKQIIPKSSEKNVDIVNMKERVDKILDKLNDSGWESLTDQEEKYLTRASKELFGDRPPN